MIDLRGRRVLILGATSSIARAIAGVMAAEGAILHLAARDTAEVDRIARDLEVRFEAQVSWSAFEALEYGTHAAFIRNVIQTLGGLDGVVLAVGELGVQEAAERDTGEALRIIAASYTSAVFLLTPLANFLEEQSSGFIVGITSVAGDRGRAANYVYGSAKAGLNTFLQGLRGRLFKHGVHVMTVKPGFVDTKMVFGRPGLFLVASPERVARDVINGLLREKEVIYTPWFWAGIMGLLRAIPEPLFKRLKI